MESPAKHRSEPPRIAIAAGVFGVIGLVGGIVVPGILDPTTVQGPLLGIFMTGPLGVFLGGHVGVLWSARHQKQTTWTELGWLAVFGGLDLPVSYTHLRAHETGRNLVCRLLLEK